MGSPDPLATGLSAVVLALVFLVGGRFRPFETLVRDRAWLLSFSAGVSIAYVFVHMMPEIATARELYAKSAKVPIPYRGLVIYFVCMIGFMIYYGLERLRNHVQDRRSDDNATVDYRIHVGGFSIYVWMVSYLLVNRLQNTDTSITLYTVAMTAHFLTIDHSLREQNRILYERRGRWLLGGMCALGWVTGFFLPLPPYFLALMVAFVSGAIIMNSAIMELPHRQEERFAGFLAGGVLYALLLFPLG
jgi:zinc transporter ZupT